jgi:tetratricopeptide (TPR) repeat protein
MPRVRLPEESRRYAQGPELLALRFRRNTLNGRWAEAADDALQLIELDPTPDMVWLQAATLLVLSGRIDAYRDLCHRMMEHFADSEASTTNNRIAKVCLLSTEVTELRAEANEMATRSVEIREREDDPAVVWAYICKGLAEYRLGNFKDVLHWTAKAESRNPDGMILDHIQLLSAMAHFQRENQPESLDYYAQAPNRLYSTCHHHDLQIREILRRECEFLLFGEEYSHYAKARDLSWQKKYDEAIAEIEIAIEAYPSDRDRRTRRARWLMKAERFQEASDRFKELVAEREFRSRNWHDLLVCLAMMGDEVQYKEYARLAAQRYWRIVQASSRRGNGRSRPTPVRSASFLEAVSMVSQACLVCPTDARNRSLAYRLADIPTNAQSLSSLRSHFHSTKGLAEYLMGRPESALRFLKASQDFNDCAGPPILAQRRFRRIILYS